MPDGLVQLERHLLRVDHDVHHACGTLRCGEQSHRLVAEARRLARETEPDDVLPARLRADPAVCARVAADLRQSVGDGCRIDARAALHGLLLDVGSLGRDQHLSLELCAHRRFRNLHFRTREVALRLETEVDLLVQRDRERVDLHGRLEAASLGLELGESPFPAACGPRERVRPLRSFACALLRQPAVGREPPGAVDEHADADALALDVVHGLDVPVLRRDRLGTAKDAARVGVRSAGANCGVDGVTAEIPHEGCDATLDVRSLALVAELVDALG